MILDVYRAGLAMALVATGCQFSTPPPEGTTFRCGAGGSCPDGFACESGFCVVRDDPRDAAPAPDGRPPDGPAPPPPDSGPRTLAFGEGPDADVRGVTADTWLDGAAVDTPHGDDVQLAIDNNGGSPDAVALIRFELEAIPRGATVARAELVWNVFGPTVGFATANALLEPWDEASATWNQPADGRAWSAPGADGDSFGAEAGRFEAPAADVYAVAIATRVVQGWVDDPASNFGLRWSLDNNNNLNLHSRDADVAAQRPLLRVTFEP